MAPRAATRVVFKNILFATDFSDASHRALLHALAMAKRYESKLTVVHVAPPETQTPIPMEPVTLEIDWQKQRAAECMARLEEFEPLRLFPHETMLRQGNPWLEMSAIIEDAGIDLVVVGTRGRACSEHWCWVRLPIRCCVTRVALC
jgi:nucleotide-binding universal stress UspA family protein